MTARRPRRAVFVGTVFFPKDAERCAVAAAIPVGCGKRDFSGWPSTQYHTGIGKIADFRRALPR